MSNIKFKMIYGSRDNLLQRSYTQGQVMLVKDSQQIIFNIDGSRRSFYGIIYLATQQDRTQIQQPDIALYLVMQSGKLYYYGEEWKQLSNGGTGALHRYANFNQLSALTQCDENSLYLDQSTNQLYIGVNLLSSVLWISVSGSSDLSDYSGNVNLKNSQNLNILNNQNDVITLGESTTVVNIDASELQYKGNSPNSAGGLVVLDENGKIPHELIQSQSDSSQSSSTISNAYFLTEVFDVRNLVQNKKFFSYVDLGISGETIVQLIDDNGVIKDDIIPMYWGSNNGVDGLWIDFSTLATNNYITQTTGYFKLKYLVAEQYSVDNSQLVTTLNTKIFDPYNYSQNQYLVSFTLQQLGLKQTTMIQLVDDTGLIRDDVIPVYWEDDNLKINFSPISSLIVESGHYWKIKYLVSVNSGNYVSKTYADEQIAQLKTRINQLTAIINALLGGQQQSSQSSNSSSTVIVQQNESGTNTLVINDEQAQYDSQTKTLQLDNGSVSDGTLIL